MPNSKRKPLTLKVVDEYVDGVMCTEILTKFGVLDPAPMIFENSITIPRVILVARVMPPSPHKGIFWRREGDMMIFNYSGQQLIYRTYPDRLVWSDGPPHPDNLQLATLLSTSGSD